MKLIMINGKKIGVTIIIIGLMIVLLGFERNFDMRLKFTALIQNNMESLIEYKGLQGRLRYELPAQWTCRNQDIFGDEILYHSDFKSDDNTINGFVEVWNLKENLKVFLQNSKSISEKQNLYKEYSIKQICLDGNRGYLIKYTITKEIGDSYKCMEYFIETGKQICRFSFFVKESDFKENMPTIFEVIVKTLKYN